MQAARSSSALAVSGEVSLSFQDELAATIHRAFEVAVEIAVVEVSKLVSQALGDVRDQMQETLRENTFLKKRLQSAEHELDTVRRGRKSKRPAADDDDDDDGDDDDQPLSDFSQHTKCESRSTAKDDSPTAQETPKIGRFDSGSERQDESFCEIREDGSVRSRDLGSASLVIQCRDQKSGNQSVNQLIRTRGVTTWVPQRGTYNPVNLNSYIHFTQPCFFWGGDKSFEC